MDADGREFRFRGDLYSQESTFPLVTEVLSLWLRLNRLVVVEGIVSLSDILITENTAQCDYNRSCCCGCSLIGWWW